MAGTGRRLLTCGASRGEASGETDNDVSGLLTCTHTPSYRRRVSPPGIIQSSSPTNPCSTRSPRRTYGTLGVLRSLVD